MARTHILGIFREAEAAADAVTRLKEAGFPPREVDVLTGAPYPAGAFGEEIGRHRLFVFPLLGAATGLAVGLLFTAGTQMSYPMITGGKPILSIPPMAIIMYEGMMLGAIVFTVIGVIFESRLPRLRMGLYDPRITEGYVGVLVSSSEDRVGAAHRALEAAGAEDIKSEHGP